MTMPASPTQSEIHFDDVKPSDQYFMRRLISEVQQDLSRRRRHLLMITSKWMISYKFLIDYENDAILACDPSSREKDFFRGTAHVLYGLGRLLLGHLKSNEDVPIEALGFTFADLEACVEDLRYTSQALETELEPPREEEIAALFR